jgi:hypothetical protein
VNRQLQAAVRRAVTAGTLPVVVAACIMPRIERWPAGRGTPVSSGSPVNTMTSGTRERA